MLLWTLALVATLELISNNLIEPWAYGSSTGLSPLAVLVSATFWTVVWGPIGLVLATPITVCLVVLGRHVRPLRIFDLLLGNEPAFDVPTTLYQRLLAGEVEDAIELARDQVREGSVAAFYAEAALPALLLTEATPDAERRERVADGMQVLLDDLDETTDEPAPAAPRLLCIGGQSELDSIAAEMVARTLSAAGHAATAKSAADLSPRSIGTLDLAGIDAVFVGYLGEAWRTRARYVCRHLRRRSASVRIVVVHWQAGATPMQGDEAASIGADALASTAEQALQRWCELGVVPSDESPAVADEPVETEPPQGRLALV
jgi:hypothetical protein